jgi:hypothetical protein
MFRRDALRLGAGVLSGVGLAAVGSSATAHPGPYQPYGRIELRGAKEAVVGADGTVFVATTSGYATVDVSTPDRPRVLADVRAPLADREAGPLRGIFDVKVDGDRLLVVGPANPLPGALAGVLVVDVADPDDPRELAFFETDYPVHNCYLADGNAYLTANDGGDNPLVILDVSGAGEGDGGGPDGDRLGPNGVREVGRWALVDHEPAWRDVWSGARAVHDVWVDDGLAYLAHWDAGTWIVDVSDPTTPAVVGSIPHDRRDPATLAALDDDEIRAESTRPPGNHHYVATDDAGDVLGIGRESWARGGRGGPGGIDLYDVSDPAAPAHLARIDPPATDAPTMGGTWTTSHNFELTDDRLYSSWYQGGVKRHDVSDPTAPRELAWWRDPEAARFWTARLVTPGATAGFFVATSMGLREAPARLYTFPDHAGTQADPPRLADAGTETPDPAVVTPSSTSTATPAGSPTAATNGSGVGSSGTDGPEDGDGEDGPEDGDGEDGRPASTAPIPGVGVLGGAAGLAGAGWWLRRRSRSDESDAE